MAAPAPGGRVPGPRQQAIWRTWRDHLPEYACEAVGLGSFMVSACVFAMVLEHPSSPVRGALPSSFARRALMGLAMGATLVANIHAPWGRRSGAHLNPAATLAFWRLGHVPLPDVAGYAAAQFAGAAAGVAAVAAIAGAALADPHVDFVVTRPGPGGAGVAFAAEFALAFVLLSVVLRFMGSARHAARTPWVAGGLVATYITFEAPLSGMSLNPARTFGSAVVAHDWRAYAVYVFAPLLAMLAAAEVRRLECASRAPADAGCAKLLHLEEDDCVFCGHRGRRAIARREPAATAECRISPGTPGDAGTSATT
jgi:aquaporin Z